MVKSKGSLYRRNRVHLHKSNETFQDEQEVPMEESSLAEATIENTAATPQVSAKPVNHKDALQTRSGRIVKPPERLNL